MPGATHDHSHNHSHSHSHSGHSHDHGRSYGDGDSHRHSPGGVSSDLHVCGPIDPAECGPVFRPRARRKSRRAFLGEFGKGTMALAVVTPVLAAACSSDGSDDSASTTEETTGSSTTDEPDTSVDSTEATTTDDADGSTEEAGGELRWGRVNMGFVSAYVLARGNSAAIVDTGTSGNAETIGETLSSMGLNYGDVDHIILTHHHGDHVGSLGEVAAEATSATVYAGEADVASIDAADIVALANDDDVFGLRIIHTPGHTPGHVAVLDETTGLLVAGDSIFTDGGGVVEGPERFFDDIPLSRESIKVMGALSFNTLLVGHGEPIEANADTAVADLAASLT